MAENVVINTGEKGEVNTASNVGTAGIGFFKQKLNDNLEFKNIIAGSSKVDLVDDVADNEISVDIVESNIVINNLNGVLTIVKGGTGATTASGARDNLGITTLLEKNFRKNFLLMGA